MDSDVPSSSPVPSEEKPHDSTHTKVHDFLDATFNTWTQQAGTSAETHPVLSTSPQLPHKPSAIWLGGGDPARGQINNALCPTAHDSELIQQSERGRERRDESGKGQTGREAGKRRETEAGKLERKGLGRDQRSSNQPLRGEASKDETPAKNSECASRGQGSVQRERGVRRVERGEKRRGERREGCRAAARKKGEAVMKEFCKCFCRFCERERKKNTAGALCPLPVYTPPHTPLHPPTQKPLHLSSFLLHFYTATRTSRSKNRMNEKRCETVTQP